MGHYRKILESQPGNLFALNNLAASLAEEANGLDEALKIAQRAEELGRDNAGIDDTLGWVLYKKGMHSTAVEYLRSSVKREPNATRHAHLAILYADRGDKTHAIEELSAAIALNASHPEVKHAVQRLATMK